MSNMYLTEPPTSGKVLLHTSYGDIDIELWSREAPLACRNFIQLALEGYYENSVVHRVIKDFMIQMGDPSGSGRGGTSIWGKPFKDEIHGRLKFNHRGQVAMANENRPNSNHSQFLITLDKCEWLNNKHTIFGKVTGDTIFNLMRMSDVEVGEEDRPLETIQLLGVEVLWNPFDDIVPRAVQIKRVENLLINADAPKKKRKALRDTKVLSFQDDHEEEGAITVKKHSIHDSKMLKDSKLKAEVAPELRQTLLEADSERTEGAAKPLDFEDKLKRMMEEKNKARKRSLQSGEAAVKSRREVLEPDVDLEDIECEDETVRMKHSREGEMQRLREGIVKSRRAVKVLLGETADKVDKDAAFHNMSSSVEAMRQKYKKRKAEHGDRQHETLTRLSAFTSTLRQSKSGDQGPKSAPREIPVYHGQVLEDNSDDEDGDGAGALGSEWCSGKLKFKKHIDDNLRLGGDGRRIDDIIVIDTATITKR